MVECTGLTCPRCSYVLPHTYAAPPTIAPLHSNQLSLCSPKLPRANALCAYLFVCIAFTLLILSTSWLTQGTIIVRTASSDASSRIYPAIIQSHRTQSEHVAGMATVVESTELAPATLTPEQLRDKPAYLDDAEYQYYLHDRTKFSQYAVYSDDEPIDLVYTWCNGTDHAFQTARSRTQKRLTDLHPESFSANRFRSERNELYSLRSVQQYMNWVNNVYIVVPDGENQVPVWLNAAHSRVHIVRHSQIYENQSHLPTFNSLSIETQLHRIPNLTQHYLYINDDFILFNHWSRTDFITHNNEYVLYYERKQVPVCRHGVTCNPASWVAGQLMYSDRLMSERYSARPRYLNAHTPIVLNKQIVAELAAEWSEAWQLTAAAQFRPHSGLFTNTFYNWYLQERQYAYVYGDKHSVALVMMTNDVADKLTETLHRLVAKRIKCVALNDDLTNSTKLALVDQTLPKYLSSVLPHKSQYEL